MDYDSLKQAILQRISIIDAASSYTNLSPSGKNLKGKSPFTNEKTPSFYVSPEKNLYYCFSSSKGGDIFNFIQEMEGVDFKGAVEILAQKAGVDIEEYRSKHSSYSKVNNLYEVLESAKDIYKNDVNTVEKYLKERGLSDETIKTWEIGFAKKGWDNLVKKMSGKEKALEQAGLVVEGSRGFYDRFRERIMFPFHNESGKIIGFSGRILNKGSEAKYINSPETPLFSKSVYLFGLYFARRLMRKLDFAILVEGQFDVVLSHQSGGFANAVSSSGTAVTKEQISQIQRITNRIVIAFDTDDAGKRATKRTASLALQQGAEVKIANLPQSKDPADVILENPDTWRESIRTAKEFIPYILESIEEHHPSVNQNRISAVKKEVLPMIFSMQDAMLKKHYIDLVATFCGIDADSVEQALANLIEKEEKEVVKVKKSAPRERLHDIAEIYYFLKDKGFEIDETLEKEGIQALVTYVGELPKKQGVGILRESIKQGEKTLESHHEDLKEIVREYLRNILKQELKKINEKRDKGLGNADSDKECLNIQNQLRGIDGWWNS